MSYHTIIEMYASPSLKDRIIACIAQEGIPNPDVVVEPYLWKITSRPDWVLAWDTAINSYTKVYNPDTGARPDVISDSMILSAVQNLRGQGLAHPDHDETAT